MTLRQLSMIISLLYFLCWFCTLDHIFFSVLPPIQVLLFLALNGGSDKDRLLRKRITIGKSFQKEAEKNKSDNFTRRNRQEQKKFYTLTRIKVQGFHNWLKFQPFLLIGGDQIELRKGVIKGEGDLKYSQQNTQNIAINVNQS